MEGEASKITGLAFENDVICYFNVDAERLAVILVGHSTPLFDLRALKIESMSLGALFILGST